MILFRKRLGQASTSARCLFPRFVKGRHCARHCLPSAASATLIGAKRPPDNFAKFGDSRNGKNGKMKTSRTIGKLFARGGIFYM